MIEKNTGKGKETNGKAYWERKKRQMGRLTGKGNKGRQ
jgi:hypothetical protein